MRKGQVAYEFLFMFFFLTIGFTLWFVFSATLQEDFSDQRSIIHLNDLGYQVQEELFTSAISGDGFSKTFSLPAVVNDESYTLDVYKAGERYFLVLEGAGFIKDYLIPPTKLVNPFQSGTNTLRVNAGLVEVNP